MAKRDRFSQVLLRSIDLITLARPKALLWQARVVLEK
eukprot:COSAG06_NODE_39987_length_406_cov_1.814332_1_plen_36_part_10